MSTLKKVIAAGAQKLVRPFCESDFPQLPKIYRQSLKDNPQGFVQDLSFHGDINVIVKHILKQNGSVLVADMKGKIIGFGALKPEDDGSIEMCKLHVRKAYQGLGVGRALAQGLVDLAGEYGHNPVKLHVTSTQSKAIKLYEQLGFYKTDRKMFTVEVNQQVRSFDTIFMEFPTISKLSLNCKA